MKVLECYEAPSDPDETVIRLQHRFLFWTWESMWCGDIVWRNVETGARAGLSLEWTLEEYADAKKFRKRGRKQEA